MDLADVTMTPPTNYCQLWRHAITSNSLKNNYLQIVFSTFKATCNYNISNNQNRRGPNHPEDPSNKFLRILDMGSISIKNQLFFWTSDTFLLWKCGNVKLGNFEISNFWFFRSHVGTRKHLRNEGIGFLRWHLVTINGILGH